MLIDRQVEVTTPRAQVDNVVGRLRNVSDIVIECSHTGWTIIRSFGG